MGQDAQEEKNSSQKPHDPMGRPAQSGIVEGEIANGQTPGDQSEDDKPRVVQGDLDPQDPKKPDSLHSCSFPSDPLSVIQRRLTSVFPRAYSGGSTSCLDFFPRKTARMLVGIQISSGRRIPKAIDPRIV
jgi:hypothetical protein